MNIQGGSLFVNSEGRTIKVDRLSGTKPKDSVDFHIDGSKATTTHTYEVFTKMLESTGYKDITQTLSGFSVFRADSFDIGNKILSTDGCYIAEIIKKDSSGVHVRLSSKGSINSKVLQNTNSTVYIYDAKDFNFKQIFTPELISELSIKFSNNVFEVIGENSKGEDVKFTVAGVSVDKSLLDKISKSYEDIHIYSIKRLTSINIQ
jgi:hypothetical protein